MNTTKPDYNNISWWTNYISSFLPSITHPPINHVTYNQSAKLSHPWPFDFNIDYGKHMVSNWYQKNDILLALIPNYKTSKIPTIIVSLLNNDSNLLIRKIDTNNPNDDLTFIESLSNYNLLPLCLNIPWTKPFLQLCCLSTI